MTGAQFAAVAFNAAGSGLKSSPGWSDATRHALRSA